MAATQANLDPAPDAAEPAGNLLVSLAPLPQGALETALANLALAFPTQSVVVATPDAMPGISSGGPLRLVQCTPQIVSSTTWLLTAMDFLNALKLAEAQQATACLLLGPESHTLQPEGIRALATSALTFDLAVAHYRLGPHEGLVNSAILFPVTRALFNTRPRFPLAIDLGLSLRMATQMASVAQKFIGANQPDALLWPVAEAAASGYSIAEADIGPREIPQAALADFNSLFALVTGSLFAEVDAKAAFWQRARASLPLRQPFHHQPPPETAPDVSSMIETFRLAYANLQDIWALVLPPNSLLGLKKLHAAPSTSFRMPDDLWTRIVYDFILAYRLRTINRGHLLGALTPLYLAWAASHLVLTASNAPTPEQHIQEQTFAFEAGKPYLVSRWRWPDRFNP